MQPVWGTGAWKQQRHQGFRKDKVSSKNILLNALFLTLKHQNLMTPLFRCPPQVWGYLPPLLQDQCQWARRGPILRLPEEGERRYGTKEQVGVALGPAVLFWMMSLAPCI